MLGVGLVRGGPVGLQDEPRDEDRDDHQQRGDDEREVVAAGQRRGERVAARGQVLGARRRERRQQGQAERAADLRRRVDEPRGQAGVLRRDVGHRDGHEGREPEAGADAEQDHRRQDVRERSRR